MSKSTQKRGLGKGFDALLPSDFDKSILSAEERVLSLDISLIQPNTEQPRHHFDPQALNELAESIRHYGVLQPLVVTRQGNGYQLVAGERRLRASQIAGLKTVPAVSRSAEQLERLEMALIENVQRVNLSPLEQAASIERLHQQFNKSYEEIAKQLGKALSTISNTVRLLQLPEKAQQALAKKVISEGHARQILALKDSPNHQAHLLVLIERHGWSVRQAEGYVIAIRDKVSKPINKQQIKPEMNNLVTKQLSQKLGTKVTIKRTSRGNRLEISFKTETELLNLIDRFK
jgi:ParB family chromosome partitioning protein